MKRGVGTSVAVFAGVLAVVAGLGWLLYSAGGAGDASTGDPAREETVKDKIIRRRPPAETASPEASAPKRPKLPTSPDAMARFVFPGHEAVKQRDWKEIAAAYVDFSKDALDMALNGRPDPDSPAMKERAAHMTRWHVVTSEMPIGIDKPEPVESKERPAFAANLIAALLEAKNMPLTEDQVRRIYAIGLVRTQEADREAEVPIEDDGVTYAVERIAARSELIDRFFTGVWDILTPEQAQYVSPAEYRYHCGVDLLSSARMISGVEFVRPYSDLPNLVDSVTDHLAAELEVSDRRDELRPIVEAWANRIPIEPLDPLERRGKHLFSCRRLIGDARRMGELLRAVVEGMKLPPETAKKARQMPIAYVPIPK